MFPVLCVLFVSSQGKSLLMWNMDSCFHSSVQLFCGHGLGLITFWDSGIMYMRTVILKMDSL